MGGKTGYKFRDEYACEFKESLVYNRKTKMLRFDAKAGKDKVKEQSSDLEKPPTDLKELSAIPEGSEDSSGSERQRLLGPDDHDTVEYLASKPTHAKVPDPMPPKTKKDPLRPLFLNSWIQKLKDRRRLFEQ